MGKEFFGTFYHAVIRVPHWFFPWDTFYFVSCMGDLTKRRQEAMVFPTTEQAFDAIKTELIDKPEWEDLEVFVCKS